MKKIFTIAFLLCALTGIMAAQTTAPTGSKPESGKTYYIYNVGKDDYLGVTDGGTLTIGANPLAVTITTSSSNAQYFTMEADGKKLVTALNESPTLEETTSDKYDQWMFQTIDEDNNVYAIGCRMREASATGFLCWSDIYSNLSIRLTSVQYFTNGQWKLVSEEDMKNKTIDLRETATEYAATDVTTPVTVNLYRTLTQNSWNTFCVPFDIDNAQLKAKFGDDVKVAEFTGLNATTLKFTSTDQVQAGVPYLLYPTAEAPADGYYTFEDVTHLASAPSSVEQTYEGTTVTFTSSFVQTTAPSRAYVISKNKIYHLTSAMTMKGFRGYFVETTSGENQSKINAWSLDDTANGISTPDSDVPAAFDVYNTAGQKVLSGATTVEGLPHGVYIVNGKKIIR